MGADLYIKDLPRKDQYTGFETNVEKGYFRDSYNNSSVLWQFDLSWWQDITNDYCTTNSEMTPRLAEELLREMKKREPMFNKNMEDLIAGVNKVWDFQGDVPVKAELSDKDRLEWELFYRKKYKMLQQFLKKAIQIKSNIECSL